MEPKQQIMKLKSDHNECSHCGRIIPKAEIYYIITQSPKGRRYCQDCYPSKVYVDWDDAEDEIEDSKPFGVTFVVTYRTGKTLDVFT